MKVLLTTHQFLPDYTSGTEVLSFEVARELIRLGHDVRILTGWPASETVDPPAAYDEYVYEGIRVHRIYPLAFGASTPAERTRAEFDNPATAAAFTAITTAWRPDVVHCFHLQRLSSSIPFRCVEQDIACIFTATDFWAICPLVQLQLPDGNTCTGPVSDSSNCVLHLALQSRRTRFAPLYHWVPKGVVGAVLRLVPQSEQSASMNLNAARALQSRSAVMRRLLAVCDRIVAPTGYMAQRLRDFGATDRSLVELSYGIDTTIYGEPRPILMGDTLRIGFIGTFREHKGPHVLIEAVKLLDPALPVSVRIYGDDPLNSDYALQLKASAASDPRISFPGTFERRDFPVVMNELDALVVPSTWSENTPLVLFAAGSAGRPIIGSDVSGIAEVVTDGVNGRLFEAGNPDALAQVLDELIRQPERLSEMARHARPAKDISRYVADLLDLYESVLMERAAFPVRRVARA